MIRTVTTLAVAILLLLAGFVMGASRPGWLPSPPAVAAV
jgi:hypothetical protein